MKRVLSVLLALLMCLSLLPAALASEDPVEPEEVENLVETVAEESEAVPDSAEEEESIEAEIISAEDSADEYPVEETGAPNTDGMAWELVAAGSEDSYVTRLVDKAGSTMELAVAIKGSASGVTYQWYYEEPVENEENTYHAYSIEGATGSSYTTSPITKSSRFYCEAEDSAGNYDRVYFIVSVNNGLTAYDAETGDQYCSLSVKYNETKEIRVKAEAKDATGITYQWYKAETVTEDGGTYTRWMPISGATKETFTTSVITANTSYQCKVTDKYGTSVEVDYSISVDSGLSIWIAGLGYKTDWLYKKCEKNSTQVLVVEAEGIGPLSYAWYAFKLVDDDGFVYWSRVNTVIATGTSFTVPALTEVVKYECVVTDSLGVSKSAEFELRIDNHFECEPEKTPVTAPYGQNATLRVIATSDDPITYQWYTTKRVSYGEWSYPEIDEPIAGATTDRLTIKALKNEDYICVIKSGDETQELTISVEIDNGFTAYVKGTEKTSAEIYSDKGKAAKLEVSASANEGSLTYQWYHEEPVEGEDYYSFVPMAGENKAALTTVAINGAEYYYCKVTDKFGTVREVYFDVFVKDGFTLVPVGSYTKVEEAHAPGVWTDYSVDVYYCYVKPGDAVTLQGQAHSDSGKDVTFEWGCLTDPYYGTLEGETKDTLTLKNVKETRYYGLAAKNTFGEYKVLYFKVVVMDGSLDANGDGTVTLPDAAVFLAKNDPNSAAQVLLYVIS